MRKTENITFLQLFAEGEANGSGTASENTAEGAGTETVSEENGITDGESSVTEEKTESAEDKNEESREKDEKKQKDAGMNTVKAIEASLREMKLAGEVKAVRAKWETDGEQLKDTYPDFDLKKAIKNPEFARLLKAGISVRRAWETVNLDNIVSTAMRYALVTSGRRTAEAITKQNSRPQETGVLDSATSMRRTDVNSLTAKDIMAILDKVGKGEKITF